VSTNGQRIFSCRIPESRRSASRQSRADDGDAVFVFQDLCLSGPRAVCLRGAGGARLAIVYNDGRRRTEGSNPIFPREIPSATGRGDTLVVDAVDFNEGDMAGSGRPSSQTEGAWTSPSASRAAMKATLHYKVRRPDRARVRQKPWKKELTTIPWAGRRGALRSTSAQENTSDWARIYGGPVSTRDMAGWAGQADGQGMGADRQERAGPGRRD